MRIRPISLLLLLPFTLPLFSCTLENLREDSDGEKTELTTIAEILAEPKDDMEVIIRGRIIEQEKGEDDYIFTDGKDKIVVEIEEENFQYNPNEIVEISGVVNLELEKGEKEGDPTPEAIEIEVKKIKTVKR